jgi:hypothetical protein
VRYTVKNWAKFQHYTGRRPPWIKLYRDLLDNYEFMSLSLASKALAPLCWLLASESDDGSFDGEIDRLAFRLRVDSKVLAECLNELIEKGFIDGASVVLAECKQLATPETETEKEKEGGQQAARPDLEFIFRDGVDSLLAGGLTEREARAVLGRMVKDFGEAETATALQAAIGKADVKTYALAILTKKRREAKEQKRFVI